MRKGYEIINKPFVFTPSTTTRDIATRYKDSAIYTILHAGWFFLWVINKISVTWAKIKRIQSKEHARSCSYKNWLSTLVVCHNELKNIITFIILSHIIISYFFIKWNTVKNVLKREVFTISIIIFFIF